MCPCGYPVVKWTPQSGKYFGGTYYKCSRPFQQGVPKPYNCTFQFQPVEGSAPQQQWQQPVAQGYGNPAQFQPQQVTVVSPLPPASAVLPQAGNSDNSVIIQKLDFIINQLNQFSTPVRLNPAGQEE